MALQGLAAQVVQLLEMLPRERGGDPWNTMQGLLALRPGCGPQSAYNIGSMVKLLVDKGPSDTALAMLDVQLRSWRAMAAQEVEQQRGETGAKRRRGVSCFCHGLHFVH